MDKIIKDSSDEYSVSPNTGRLRKRVKVRRKKSFFRRSKIKRILEYTFWISILVLFLYSLIIVLPEMGIVSDKNPKKTRPK